MFGPFVTDCTCIGTCIGTSPDPRFSLSLSLPPSISVCLSVSVSGYITGNFHVYEQVRSAQSWCNSGIENYDDDFLFIFSFACMRTSFGSYLCLSICL